MVGRDWTARAVARRVVAIVDVRIVGVVVVVVLDVIVVVVVVVVVVVAVFTDDAAAQCATPPSGSGISVCRRSTPDPE